MEKRPSRAELAMDAIDRGLYEVRHITIESALEEAVAAGRMDIKEAEECREAYYRTFHGHRERLSSESSEGSEAAASD